MKKRILAIMLMATLSISAVACGDNGKEVESEKKVVETNAENKTEENEVEEETDDSTTGEIVEENGIRKEPVVTNKELNKTGEAGPFNYTLEAIQISKLTATTDDAAELLGIDKDKEVTLVVFDVSVENTSDETLYFYFDQATLTTNTKEQVDSNMLLSDYIDGEYLGNVIHSGSIMYILPNTNANDLTNLSLHVSAPSNENFENVAEDVKIDLTFE